MGSFSTENPRWRYWAWITIEGIFPKGTDEWEQANSAIWDGDWDTLKAIEQKARDIEYQRVQEYLYHG